MSDRVQYQVLYVDRYKTVIKWQIFFEVKQLKCLFIIWAKEFHEKDHDKNCPKPFTDIDCIKLF